MAQQSPGINHITIAAILRHRDLRMTQRYAQSTSDKRRAVKLLESRNCANNAKRKGTYRGKCLKLNGGAEGGRTPDLRIANAALCQTELLPHTRNLMLKTRRQTVKRKLQSY